MGGFWVLASQASPPLPIPTGAAGLVTLSRPSEGGKQIIATKYMGDLGNPRGPAGWVGRVAAVMVVWVGGGGGSVSSTYGAAAPREAVHLDVLGQVVTPCKLLLTHGALVGLHA